MAGRTLTGKARASQQGLGYLVVMFWVALASLTLAGEAALWSKERQREREVELLFVGDQMRRAIGSYYEAAPGEVKRFPASLEVLLSDTRFVPARRHLRRIYADPMTGKAAWGLVLTPEGGVTGVYSTSRDAPIKRAGFAQQDAEFEHKAQYTEWRFIHHATRTVFLPPTMFRYVEPVGAGQ